MERVLHLAHYLTIGGIMNRSNRHRNKVSVMSGSSTVVVLATLWCLSIASVTAEQFTSTTCPGADPYDQVSDTAALQYCVDNYDVVSLEPSGGGGYYGYYIGENSGNGLRIRNFGRGYGPSLETNGEGKAHLVAMDDLEYPMIDVDSETYGWEMHSLVIDGNRYGRSALKSECVGYRGLLSNVLAKGSTFYVAGVESVRALCGSGFEVHGDTFEIHNSSFVDNGTEVGEAASGTEPWADGLTLLYCGNGYVHDNSFYDNTDVDLMVANGENCYIGRNYIEHTNKAGIAGIHVGAYAGDLPGSHTYLNEIYSDENLLRAGMIVGHHPWDNGYTAEDVGEIYENDIYGAVINLAIDGISDGYIYDNVLSNHRGNVGLGSCTTAYAYTAGHVGSATIDSGYTSLVYDNGGCYVP